MFSTIVVGVDQRAGGRHALAFARRLAEVAGGALVAVHVCPDERLPIRGLRVDGEEPARSEVRALLQRQLAQAGVEARPTVVSDSSVARGLHRAAEAHHADLLVVGSPRLGAVGRIFAGDTVRAVVHGAGCPVAVVPPTSGAPLVDPVIGVGHDGSRESRSALAWTGRLAEAVGAKVRVLSAVDPGRAGFAPAVSYGFNWTGARPPRREHAERLAAEAVGELGTCATARTVVGVAERELTRLSGEVDLLVLGSHGYGAVGRALLGSTSDKVIHDTACPLVIVPRTATVRDSRHGPERAEALR